MFRCFRKKENLARRQFNLYIVHLEIFKFFILKIRNPSSKYHQLQEKDLAQKSIFRQKLFQKLSS